MSTNEQQQTSTGQEAPVEDNSVNWEERYKNLQSYADKTIAQLKKQTTVFTPPKTTEELEEFKKSNPDWMGVIETVAYQIASNSIKPLQEELKGTKIREAAAQIRAAHPDFIDIYNSEDFKQWASEQGSEIQSWISEEEDSSKVIRALNYYKAMRSPQVSLAPTQYQEPSAARQVSTHGSVVTPQGSESPRRFTRAQIARMHPAEYEKNEKAILQAQRLGLIT